MLPFCSEFIIFSFPL